jgi:hypothetical protein
METENQIERTIGLVILAVLAIGCLLVLRPFFTAAASRSSWSSRPSRRFERLQHLLRGRRMLAALVKVWRSSVRISSGTSTLVASGADANHVDIVLNRLADTFCHRASCAREHRRGAGFCP